MDKLRIKAKSVMQCLLPLLLLWGCSRRPADLQKGEDQRIGYLAEFEMQHPVPMLLHRGIAPYHAIDIYRNGRYVHQILVAFDSTSAPSLKPDARYRFVGVVHRRDLGGPAGTKGEYKGEVIYARRWEELTPSDYPEWLRPK